MKEATFAKTKANDGFLYLIRWDEVAAVFKEDTMAKVLFKSGYVSNIDFGSEKEVLTFMEMFNAYLTR